MRVRARGTRRGDPGRRGAALILVVVVIAALLAIGAPFILSMRLHEKSSAGFEAQVRAEHLAESGRNLAAAHLLRSHPDEERRAREQAGDLASDPEGVDAWAEVSDVPLGPLPGRFGLRTDDPTSTLLHVEVRDERGKLDLNTAGGDALANLLGVTVSTAPLSYDATDELRVEDSTPFWTDGDPATLDGFVRIGAEDIAYRHIDRARHALQGLRRGYLFSRWIPPEDEAVRRELHPAGSLVQDGRGRKIALDPLWRYLGTEREGQLARFDNVAAVRRIADWELGVARMRLVLGRMGLTMRQLRTWGIDGADLERAGLSAAELDPDVPPPGETSEERAAREEAERTLRRYGLDPELVRRYGGVRAVLRTATQLEALPSEARRALAERYEEFHTKRQEELAKVSGWLREEMRFQLAGLSEARNEAPRLETIGRIELEERLRPYLTVDALPEGEAWSDPQPVNHPLRFALEQGGSTLTIADSRRFRSGAVVQVRPRPGTPVAGLPPEFRLIWNARERRDEGRVALVPPLERDYEASEVEVSARLPRPVNVNTASREVLRAALTGLQSRVKQPQRATGRQAPDIVTPREAAAIARALVEHEGGLSGPDELRALLIELASEGTITDPDVDAVVRNAIDPCDDQLVRATVPFCYASSDTYEVTSTGIIGTPAGLEQARHTLRDVVRVAPPRLLTWRIDSQADFTDRLYVEGPRPNDFVRDDAARLFLPGRWQNLLQSRPVHLGPYGATPWLMPSRSHAPGEGDILPLLAREAQDGLPEGSAAEPDWSGPSGGPQAGWLRFERFDALPEGVPLGSFGIGRVDMPSRWYQLEDGDGRQAAGPGLARGWVRFDSLPAPGQKAFLLDGGERDTIERISLYLEGPNRLVLEAWDEALDLQETGGHPRSARVVHERATPFRQGNWYYIAAFFKGTEPGDLALAVDGEFRFRDETPGSRLAVALDPTATTLTVEDASSLPDQGWIRVGAGRWLTSPSAEDRGIADTGQDANARCEVLHYSRKSGNTLYLDAHPQPVAALLASGATVQRVRDQDDGNRAIAPGSLPPEVRRPERGSGHRVRVDYVPAAPAQPRRRSLTFMLGFAHGVGTRVVPYGFHSQVKDEANGFQDVVRRGGRRLARWLPPNTPATVLYAPVPGYTRQNQLNQGADFDRRPVVLPAGETQRIPVLWAGPERDPRTDPNPVPPLQGGETEADRPENVVGGWPQGGVVRISSSWTSPTGAVYQSVERVYFERVIKVGSQYFLDGCRRGVEGTDAADHVLFASVVLESIELDGPAGTDYPPRANVTDPRVYVSLSRADPSAASGRVTEWLSVQHPQNPRDLGGRHFLLLPARDTLLAMPPAPITVPLPNGQSVSVTTPGGPGVIEFPYVNELIDQLLDAGGAFADPDTLVAAPLVNLPLAIRGQLWKEVLKRWDPSDASSPPPLRLAINGRNVTVPRPPGLAEAGARKTKGTRAPAAGWPIGTPVVPTFAIRPGDGANWGANAGSVQPFGAECGEGDIVTVADDQQDVSPRREEARVVWSAPSLSGGNLPGGLTAGLLSPLGVVPDAADGWLVAFEDFVSREYLGVANARLARWPVGNLHSIPELVGGRARPPTDASDVVADAPGVLEGRVDDTVVQQLEDGANSILTLGAPLAADDTASPPVNGQPEAWDDGRLYLAGSELIAVVGAGDATGGVTLTLQRGALGTQAQAVGADTPLWRLPWPPVAVSADGFTTLDGSEAAALPIRPLRGQRPFREGGDGGYLRIGADYDQPARILPYARFWGPTRWNPNPCFVRPTDALGRGTFESAFGANPAAPVAGELLVDMPFRHHDRYRDAVDSLEGVFFQASRELPGSFVERVTWEEHLPPHSRAEVKVAVRIDGAPGWDATPWADAPGQRGRLYVFDDPGADNRIGLAAERVELRVYLTFLAGAFAQDAWKDGALVGAVEVQYRQPTQSLRREERAR